MSWIQRLAERGGRIAFERVRQSPRFQKIERQQRLATPIITTAELLAKSTADDEMLAGRLRARLKDPEAARFASEDLRRHGDDFFRDRAYRILYAAVHGGAVPPVAPQDEEAFRAQEKLARLPLRRAFASLAELTPGLRDLELRVADGRWRADAHEAAADLVAYLDERIKHVLDSLDIARSRVLSSVVARVIALRYLMLVSGEPGVLGDLDSQLVGSEDIKI